MFFSYQLSVLSYQLRVLLWRVQQKQYAETRRNTQAKTPEAKTPQERTLKIERFFEKKRTEN